MGLEFISTSRRDYKKEWAKGLERTAQPDLWDPAFTSRQFVVSADLKHDVKMTLGEVVTVERVGDQFCIFSGLSAVGVVVRPSSDVVAWLDDHDGHALARVERIGLFLDTAELLLK